MVMMPELRVPPIIAEIKETHRLRTDLHRAEKRLTLQIKAIERRVSGTVKLLDTAHEMSRYDDGADIFLDTKSVVPQSDEGGDDQKGPDDQKHSEIAAFATIPLNEARKAIKPERLKAERRVAELAKMLPAWSWVESIHGFGSLGFGQIVGEAGDLDNFPAPAKLWKWMCVGMVNGAIQRKVRGAEALEHKYSPERRAVMWNIGESLIKKQNVYRDLYLLRKAYEIERNEDGYNKTKATEMLKHGKYGDVNIKILKSGKLPPFMMHNRARRYVEKRLLKDLWKVWRT